MIPSERNLPEPFYFVTAAVGGWKHLFANEACARTVFDSLDHLSRTEKLALYAFALLPSHLCLLFRPLRGNARRAVEEFAEFTAARMASVLRRRGRGPLMHYLHA
jgi:putative transposase